MGPITVTFYHKNGSKSHSCVYETAELAFEGCGQYNLDALAHPVNTTSGAYNWNPSKSHTLEGFRNKLSICCNSPQEYSDGLQKLYGFWSH